MNFWRAARLRWRLLELALKFGLDATSGIPCADDQSESRLSCGRVHRAVVTIPGFFDERIQSAAAGAEIKSSTKCRPGPLAAHMTPSSANGAVNRTFPDMTNTIPNDRAQTGILDCREAIRLVIGR